MKKFITAVALLTMSLSAMAGTINGKLAKIRVYERDNHIKFESKIPNLTIRATKLSILKAMKTRGQANTIVQVERQGLIMEHEKKVGAKLTRVGDGLYIKTRDVNMFVSERELDKIKD